MEKDGRKKTRRTLREKETIGYAETIEKITKKNLMVIKRLIKRNLENRTDTTIGLRAWNRNHPDELMTHEEYVAYRQQKERKKKQKEIKND